MDKHILRNSCICLRHYRRIPSNNEKKTKTDLLDTVLLFIHPEYDKWDMTKGG